MEQEEILKPKLPRVILTGVGHIGRQSLIAETILKEMHSKIEVIVCNLDEVPLIRIQENQKDLFVFLDVTNSTNLIEPLPINKEEFLKDVQDNALAYEEILESFNKCFDVNKTARERFFDNYLYTGLSNKIHINELLILLTEQRKRRKDFAHIINDDGYLENSLMHMRQLIKVFFKSQVPAP